MGAGAEIRLHINMWLYLHAHASPFLLEVNFFNPHPHPPSGVKKSRFPAFSGKVQISRKIEGIRLGWRSSSSISRRAEEHHRHTHEWRRLDNRLRGAYGGVNSGSSETCFPRHYSLQEKYTKQQLHRFTVVARFMHDYVNGRNPDE